MRPFEELELIVGAAFSLIRVVAYIALAAVLLWLILGVVGVALKW